MKDIISLHQAHEFFLALRPFGFDSKLAQQVVESKKLAADVVSLIQGGNNGLQLSESQKNAQAIMGKNFFGISEAMLHFGVVPTAEQIASFTDVPYTAEVLRECKDTHILVAVFPISILEIREKAGKHFYSQSWYDSDEDFALQQGGIGWWLVRKTAVEDSFSKNWVEQQALLGKEEQVPDARVVVQTAIGHFLATGERLFPDKYVRTSNLDSGGYRVHVGYFGSDGLYLCRWDGGYRDGRIGLASSRKFRPLKS